MPHDETIKSLIEHRLNETFAPQALQVIDESHHHHGHAGWREGGETHFRVRIAAEVFRGLTRVDMHRRINGALKEAFDRGLHALAIEAKAP